MSNHPLLNRFILFIVVPLIILLIWLWQVVNSSLIELDGQSISAGVDSPVQLVRDDMGMMFIQAQNDKDAFFAMGFVQAKDRLWQLEIQRRIAKGTLSEVFGKTMVSRDVWMRTLGMYQAAQKAWPGLSDGAKTALTAYSAGVNHYLAQQHELPVEFLLFDIEPQPWTEIDSLAWIKVFALNLAGNLRQEMEHYAAASVLDDKQLAMLYPHLAGSDVAYVDETSPLSAQTSDVVLPSFATLNQLQLQLEKQLQLGGKFIGSNAWVVNGDFTQDGLPTLANDPHLGLQIPSLWYGASLKGDKLNVQGMALVGLPMIIFGRNEHIAWGGTNLMADVQDLVVEKVDINRPDQYWYQGAWHQMDSRIETISVRADFPTFMRKSLKPVEVEVRTTRNGPIVSDIHKVVNQPVSLRFTALDENDGSFDSFLAINYAQNWQEFNQASEMLLAPALNLLYADSANNIGLVVAGKIPVRAKGKGMLPVAGWDSRYDWQGFIPASEMPQIFNPEKGYIVSANDQAYDADYPHFISSAFAPKARAQRISQLIEMHNHSGEKAAKLTLEDHVSIFGDTKDLAIQSILPLLKQTTCQTSRQCEALEVVNAWQGQMQTDEAAATIVTVWIEQLKIALLQDKLSSFWQQSAKQQLLSATVANTPISVLVDILSNQSEQWCGSNQQQTQPQMLDCQQVMLNALDESLAEIERFAGSNMDDWGWGELHVTEYRHLPLSEVKFIKGFFERTIASGGSQNSVNAANANYMPSQGYVQNFGAGFRQLMFVGDKEQGHWLMNSTGQSGHFLSRHFDDSIEPFHRLQLHQLNSAKPKPSGRFKLIPQPH